MRAKKNRDTIQSHIVKVCMSVIELQQLKAKLANSTCYSLSQYVRKCCLEEPVTVLYRNQSFDEFVNEIVLLRKLLQDILDKGKDEKVAEMITIIKQTINQIADHVRKDHYQQKHRKHSELS